jgi:nucleoside-diphosphate kinase
LHVFKARTFKISPLIKRIFMEKTLVIFKPCTIQRGLVGEIISRFEKKGLLLAGMKMAWLSDEILSEHYAHLKDKPFFQRVKDSMRTCPVIVACWIGVDAVAVVRSLVGTTNGRSAQPGTIRGDFSVSVQENVVHASDSIETADVEVKRFFQAHELFEYKLSLLSNLYSNDEI